MSTHRPQWVHLFLSTTGGIIIGSCIALSPFRNRLSTNIFNNQVLIHGGVCISIIRAPVLAACLFSLFGSDTDEFTQVDKVQYL
jgi:hypothetical protein